MHPMYFCSTGDSRTIGSAMVPSLSDGRGVSSKRSTPVKSASISRRSTPSLIRFPSFSFSSFNFHNWQEYVPSPVACSKLVGTSPFCAPGPNRSKSDLTASMSKLTVGVGSTLDSECFALATREEEWLVVAVIILIGCSCEYDCCNCEQFLRY